MKTRLCCITILFFLLCSLLKVSAQENCIENKKFKEKFFLSIQRVEDYVIGKGNKKHFKKSLKFISRYVHVSYDKMLNYNSSYTRYEDFEKDKTEWSKWYELNKCSNLQIKK
jgi:hypothetical protein